MRPGVPLPRAGGCPLHTLHLHVRFDPLAWLPHLTVHCCSSGLPEHTRPAESPSTCLPACQGSEDLEIKGLLGTFWSYLCYCPVNQGAKWLQMVTRTGHVGMKYGQPQHRLLFGLFSLPFSHLIPAGPLGTRKIHTVASAHSNQQAAARAEA